MAHWKKLLHAWYSKGELKSQEKNELKEIQEKLKTKQKTLVSLVTENNKILKLRFENQKYKTTS